MLKNFLPGIIFLLPLASISQNSFVQRYDSNYIRICEQTRDSGYIFYSSGYFNAEIRLVKLDPSGNVQWAKKFGGGIPGSEYAGAVHQTFDGGYIIGGSTQRFGNGGYDAYLVKTDQAGNMQWSKTLGDTGYDVINALVQSMDSSYLVLGTTNDFSASGKDLFVAKINSLGGLMWSKIIGTALNETATDIREDVNGNIIVLGLLDATPSSFVLCKLDVSGNLLWENKYSSQVNLYPANILIPQSGGMVIGADSYYGQTDILRLDNTGNINWANTYSGPLFYGMGNMTLTKKQNIVYACSTLVQTGGGGFFEIDTTGQIVSARAYSPSATGLQSLFPTRDSGWVSVSYNYLFKDNGQVGSCNDVPINIFSSPLSYTVVPLSPSVNNGGALINAGTLISAYTLQNSLLCLTRNEELLQSEPEIYAYTGNHSIILSVKGIDNGTPITCSLLSLLGEGILTFELKASDKIELNYPYLSDGIYIIHIDCNNKGKHFSKTFKFPYIQ